MSLKSNVNDLRFALIYVDQLATCKPFYEKYLGFEQLQEFRPGEIWGKCGGAFLWMGEGYARIGGSEKSTRASVMIGVKSVGLLHKALKDGGERLIHDQPMDMGKGSFWLQFMDPAGNVIEVLGGK